MTAASAGRRVARRLGLVAALVGLVSVAGYAPDIPDIYLRAGNSIVITVPNLSRVAVGDPDVITATVVSPTEVLVQGHQRTVAATETTTETTSEGGTSEVERVTENDAATSLIMGLGINTSHLYVWSGSTRYIYRVVVLNPSPEDLPPNVSRIEIEPDRLVLYGRSDFQSEVDDITRSATDAGLNVDVRIGVTSPEEIAAREMERIDDAAVELAISNHIVLEGMTEDQMLAALGDPPSPPTIYMREGTPVWEYRYPSRIVRMIGGYVTEVLSYTQPDIPAEGGPLTVSTGQRTAQIYRLHYAEPAEVSFIIRQFLGEEATFAVQEYTRTIIIEDAPQNITIADRLIRLLDTPRYDGGISILRTEYLLGAQAMSMEGGRGGEAGTTNSEFRKEVILIRMGALVDDQTRNQLMEDLTALGEDIYFRFVMPWEPQDRARFIFTMHMRQDVIVIIGPPGILDIFTTYVTQNFVTMTNADIQRAVESHVILPGMTRQQAEAALGERPLSEPAPIRRREGVRWEYEYPSHVLRFKNDQLVEIHIRPTPEAIAAAKRDRQVIWGITFSDLKEILGEEPLSSSPGTYGRTLYRFDGGEAVFLNGRLEEFAPSVGSDLVISSDLLQSASGEIVQTAGLPPIRDEDRQELISNGIVTRGMSLQEAVRALGGAQPSEVEAEVGADGSVLWTFKYPGQELVVRNGLVVNVRSTSGEDLMLQIFELKSRPAEDILSLINTAFYEEPQAGEEGGEGTSGGEGEGDGGGGSEEATISALFGEIPTGTQGGVAEIPDGAIAVADSTANTVIIRDSAERLQQIGRFINALDEPSDFQVLIEAQFVELTENALDRLGISWNLIGANDEGNSIYGIGTPHPESFNSNQASDVSLSNGSQTIDMSHITAGTNPVEDFTLGILARTGDLGDMRLSSLAGQISALESDGDATILSSPRIMTSNNQTATLRNTLVVYDVTTTQTTSEGGVSVSVTTDEKDVGITLEVTPTVARDGIITLDIDALVSSLSPRNDVNIQTATYAALLHATQEREIQTSVMVRSGTTLIMGGLMQEANTTQNSRVPVLGNIPGLGRLFRSDHRNLESQDLVVFITARIVPPDGTLHEADMLGRPDLAEVSGYRSTNAGAEPVVRRR